MESVDKNNRFWLKAIAVDQDFGSASVDECVCFLISSIFSGFYVEHKHAVDDEWANIRAQSTNIRMQFNGNLWTEWKVKSEKSGAEERQPSKRHDGQAGPWHGMKCDLES